jgi:transcriptional regulator with XRE-family HTH domain
MSESDKKPYDDKVNKAIRLLVEAQGWTLAQLAEEAGMSSVVLYQKMRRQQRKRLTGEDVARLAEALGVDPFAIATGEIPPLKLADDGPFSVTRRYRLEPAG